MIFIWSRFGKNILSVAQLMKRGFVLNFDIYIDIQNKGNMITFACLINDLPFPKPIYPKIFDTNTNSDLQWESKSLKLDLNDLTCLWYL